MLGINLDEHLDEPSKYLLDRKLPWLQACCGASAVTTFGIRQVQSVWLIGPDGEIIARSMPNWNIDQAVKQAMGKK